MGGEGCAIFQLGKSDGGSHGRWCNGFPIVTVGKGIMGVSGTVSTDGLEGFYSRGGEVRYFAWRAADMGLSAL